MLGRLGSLGQGTPKRRDLMNMDGFEFGRYFLGLVNVGDVDHSISESSVCRRCWVAS